MGKRAGVVSDRTGRSGQEWAGKRLIFVKSEIAECICGDGALIYFSILCLRTENLHDTVFTRLTAYRTSVKVKKQDSGRLRISIRGRVSYVVENTRTGVIVNGVCGYGGGWQIRI